MKDFCVRVRSIFYSGVLAKLVLIHRFIIAAMDKEVLKTALHDMLPRLPLSEEYNRGGRSGDMV